MPHAEAYTTGRGDNNVQQISTFFPSFFISFRTYTAFFSTELRLRIGKQFFSIDLDFWGISFRRKFNVSSRFNK